MTSPPVMNLPLRAGLVACVLLLASTATARPSESEVSLGLSGLRYLSFLRPSADFLTVEGVYLMRPGEQGLGRVLQLGGGLRTGTPAGDSRFPLEAFLRAQLTFRLGNWEAVAGPEVGVSGFALLVQRTVLPSEELFAREDERLGLLYVAFNAAPLRLRFGRFLVSALELQVGTAAPSMGSTLRVQLGLLRMGMTL